VLNEKNGIKRVLKVVTRVKSKKEEVSRGVKKRGPNVVLKSIKDLEQMPLFLFFAIYHDTRYANISSNRVD